MAADFMHDRLPPVLQGGPAAVNGDSGGDAKSKKGAQKRGRWAIKITCN